MPTNANTFNSRVTSEALEAKFRQVFPSQAGAELIQDLFASGVITPVVDFTDTAIGSVLRQDLQTAIDFGISSYQTFNTSTNIIANSGFYLVRYNISAKQDGVSSGNATGSITDGLSTKNIFTYRYFPGSGADSDIVTENELVIFVRPGETVSVASSNTNIQINSVVRQIADLYGNLVNPLGFVSQ